MRELLVAVVIVAILLSLPFLLMSEPKVIKVFHAGSLTVPLKEIVKEYDGNVEIRLEGSGSVEAAGKITELGKRADILASADYRLIPSMMYPNYADWYVIFATNEIVLAYTEKSKYADEINSENWSQILMRDDVKFGFSDPNKDPCGYRSVMTLLLASKLYNVPLDELLRENTNMRIEGTEAWVPDPVEVKVERIVIRPKSVELISLLEAGSLDYAFEYKSVAVQHNLKYVDLPSQIDLGSPDDKMVAVYSKAVVHIFVGSDKERKLTGAPIAYGLTIPKVAENKEGALKFVKFILTKGLDIFDRLGQPAVRPPVAYGNVPAELRDVVEVRP
ncbi:MAG: tungstate ABC transporter substrate-binding protein WtpA [Candidatus Korarchaeota archaeon]|nr:tungstate ABC transporter substrate-binding protein WtpA [Candidatus Korarchaeota archaeon]